jgi:hypothetical protein
MKEALGVIGGIAVLILGSTLGLDLLGGDRTSTESFTGADSSWKTDTSSDEPSYFVDTEYTEVMGTDSCTQDCSGHSAGWEWAEEYEICDPDYDNGNSDSFNEGVNQWTEENC